MTCSEKHRSFPFVTNLKIASFVAIDNTGYVKYFALNANSLNNNVEFEVEEGAKKSTIRSAFKKSLAGKKLNKKVLSQFVELIS